MSERDGSPIYSCTSGSPSSNVTGMNRSPYVDALSKPSNPMSLVNIIRTSRRKRYESSNKKQQHGQFDTNDLFPHRPYSEILRTAVEITEETERFLREREESVATSFDKELPTD